MFNKILFYCLGNKTKVYRKINSILVIYIIYTVFTISRAPSQKAGGTYRR